MTDGTINVSSFLITQQSLWYRQWIRVWSQVEFQAQMDTMIDYDSNILNSFRTNVFDAIMIYGFLIGKAATGIVKAKLKILDGLR